MSYHKVLPGESYSWVSKNGFSLPLQLIGTKESLCRTLQWFSFEISSEGAAFSTTMKVKEICLTEKSDGGLATVTKQLSTVTDIWLNGVTYVLSHSNQILCGRCCLYCYWTRAARMSVTRPSRISIQIASNDDQWPCADENMRWNRNKASTSYQLYWKSLF